MVHDDPAGVDDDNYKLNLDDVGGDDAEVIINKNNVSLS